MKSRAFATAGVNTAMPLAGAADYVQTQLIDFYRQGTPTRGHAENFGVIACCKTRRSMNNA